MGVHSVCVRSSVAIRADQTKEALKALKKGVAELGFFDSRNVEFSGSLPEALEKLDFEFEVVDGEIREIQFGGGKGDNSVHILPILAPYIAEGSELVMTHDDEREVWEFFGGQFERYIDDDYDDEDEDDISDEAYELFDLVSDLQFTEKDVASAIKAEGNLDFRGEDNDTIVMTFLSAVADGADDDDEDILRRQPTPEGLHEKFEILLRHKPDLNLVNYYEESALYTALNAGLFDLAGQLIDNGADLFLKKVPSPFRIAAARRSHDLLKFLADKGHALSDNADDMLVVACASREYAPGKLDFVRYLVDEAGVDINQSIAEGLSTWTGELRAGATPLMAAAVSDDPGVTAYLLEKGADTDVKDSAGNTALHYCSGQTWYSGDGDRCWHADRGNLDVVKLLATDAKAINARNRSSQSSYSLARQQNKPALAYFREVMERDGAPLPVEVSDELNGEVTASPEGQMGYALNFKDGNLHGRQRFINANGSPFVEIDYAEGKAHGEYKCFYDDGKLMFDATCEDGKWHGDVKMMSKNGMVGQHLQYQNGRRHGRQLLLNDDGTPIIDAHYVDGKKHGHFFFKKPGGDVVVDEEFVDGVPKETAEDSAGEEKKDGLAGLFGALMGAISKGMLAAEMAEDMIKPTDKLFFHKQEKVLAFFEKMQSKVLEQTSQV